MHPLGALEHVPAFATLPHEALATLARRARRRRFPAGAHFIRQGDASDLIFVLLSGRVRVECTHPALRDAVELAELYPGAFVAERGILTARPRTATIVALAETDVLEFRAAQVVNLLASVPEALSLLRMLRCAGQGYQSIQHDLLLGQPDVNCSAQHCLSPVP
jgi:CRP/FNR family cyclic AMP-dependent transcriptional regulator